MRHLFREVEVACDNTLWIAERANVEIEFGKPQLPRFPLPEGFADDGDYLRHLTLRGRRGSGGATQLPDTVVERLAYELKVIDDMGFSAYFLIVWDLIRHARDHGIRVGPGRGSAAGCAVAYCLRITDLDPIRYDLLFERFLNPSRDLDARHRHGLRLPLPRRDDPLRRREYGRDHVAQIVTFSTIKARAAVRDAARVLGYPYAVGDKVAKAMPPLVMGRDTPLYACLEQHPKYEDGYKMAGRAARHVRGRPRREARRRRRQGPRGAAPPGRHPRRRRGHHQGAAHRVPADPAQARAGPGPRAGARRHPVRDGRRRGARPAEDGLPRPAQPRRHHRHPRDDQGVPRRRRRHRRRRRSTTTQTLEMLRRGDSIGVFQLEGGPMRALMRSLAPTSFEDVAALVALYRPGPDGGEHAQRLRRPQERPEAGRRTSTPTPRSSSADTLRA